MPLKTEEVIARIEKALDWVLLYKPPAVERRLKDIEDEIARLRGIKQDKRPSASELYYGDKR